MGGTCIFFTGLSGAGKTTLAERLRDVLTPTYGYVSLIDGDVVRALSGTLSFTKEDRDLNVRRVGMLACEIVQHGGIVICAMIAPYEDVRQAIAGTIRQHGDFVLVHVATPLAVCEERDVKGLYARARAGEIQHFTGIDDPYEVPQDPDVIIDTTNREPLESLTPLVVRLCGKGVSK